MNEQSIIAKEGNGIAGLPEMAIHPLWLHFRDRAFEQRFYQSWLRATGPVNRIWSLCAVAFYVLYTAVLYASLPEQQHEFLWLRNAFALPIILLAQTPVFFSSRLKPLIGASYLGGMLTGFSLALFLFATTSREHHIVYFFEMGVIFVFAQHYNRILFLYCVAFTLIAGSTTIAVVVMQPGLSDMPALPFCTAIAAFGLVGIFSNYTRETFVRRNYRSIQMLREENRRSADLALRATAASEAKSRFLAIINHELRTPLNAIIGYAEMIGQGIFGAVGNARIGDAIADIGDSGRHLQEIVEDVLALSHATNGTVELEESQFDCAALIAEVVEGFAPEFAKRQGALSIAGVRQPIYLHADRRLVKHMLTNLLSNALKFTACDDSIDIAAMTLPTGELAIEVRDTGIGIAEEKIDAALSAFGQSDDGLDRRYEGIGIGLPLTKEFIALHGGALDLDSEPGAGTRARLIFPSQRVAPAGSSQESRVSASKNATPHDTRADVSTAVSGSALTL